MKTIPPISLQNAFNQHPDCGVVFGDLFHWGKRNGAVCKTYCFGHGQWE